MKLTINANEIKQGDTVVGFNSKIESISRTQNKFGGIEISVKFENGRTWKTSPHFETTVIR